MAEEEIDRKLSFLGAEASFEIRWVLHPETQELYYSVTDLIAALLPDSPDPASYWRTLKRRLKSEEGFDEAASQIEQFPLKSRDGRFRNTDTANRQALLRIIQSVPSPLAEPVRMWLAQVGEERIEDAEHPETALERVRIIWSEKGYDAAWIEARIKTDLIRNELTDEWKMRGAQEGVQYAILTETIHRGTFNLTIQAHKSLKSLPKSANPRDHMTPIELAMVALGEATAVENHRDRDSQGFDALQQDAIDAGSAAGEARKAFEKARGKRVVSSENYLHLKGVKGKKKQPQIEQKKEPTLFDTPDTND